LADASRPLYDARFSREVQMKTYSVVVLAFIVVALQIQAYAGTATQRLSPGEHEVERNGVQFWYAVVGHGPVLVVQAPGWGIGSTYLQNGLAPFARNFKVIFYDTRGSGHSSRPTDNTRMSTTDMLDDLDALREYWGLHAIRVIGHSHGAEIALDYAVLHPDRVRELILLDSPLPGYDAGPDRKKQIELRSNDKRFTEAIAEMQGSKEPKTDEEFGASLHRILPLYFYDPIANMPTFEKTATALPSAWVFHAYPAADTKHPVEVANKLDRVRARTLIVVGSDDWICPVSISERIHAGIRNSELLVLSRAGHFPWIESPTDFFRAVTRFAAK
jgi:proline iminopeptidase